MHCANYKLLSSWWRHQMETFSALLTLCAVNSLVTAEFPSQRPVTRGFDVFLDLRLNKLLSKQSRSWLFETPSQSLWRHCNILSVNDLKWPFLSMCLTYKIWHFFDTDYINGWVQDCSISIANTLEIMQSCTKPSMYDLEENVQIHLLGWQFYLPGPSASGTYLALGSFKIDKIL